MTMTYLKFLTAASAVIVMLIIPSAASAQDDGINCPEVATQSGTLTTTVTAHRTRLTGKLTGNARVTPLEAVVGDAEDRRTVLTHCRQTLRATVTVTIDGRRVARKSGRCTTTANGTCRFSRRISARYGKLDGGERVRTTIVFRATDPDGRIVRRRETMSGKVAQPQRRVIVA